MFLQVSFEFVSSQVGLVESFWRYVIPDLNISVPFLLVGHTRDPNISMDRSHMNFKSLLIGHEAMEQVHIINDEVTPFSFRFDEASLQSPGFSTTLQVNPLAGILQPKSK